MIPLLLGLTGIYLGYRDRVEKRTRLKNEAPAKIDNVETVRFVDPVFGNERTAHVVVSFSFSVDNIRYQGVVKMDSAEAAQYMPWSNAKVCFDPSDPTTITEAILFPSAHACGR